MEFEDVDMRATLAEESALAKSKMEALRLFFLMYERLLCQGIVASEVTSLVFLGLSFGVGSVTVLVYVERYIHDSRHEDCWGSSGISLLHGHGWRAQ